MVAVHSVYFALLFLPVERNDRFSTSEANTIGNGALTWACASIFSSIKPVETIDDSLAICITEKAV